jgi:hypothetical protein
MAKGGNTWCKKLMNKRKAFILKRAIGNEVGVMNYCAKAKPATARAQDRQNIVDKPLPVGPRNEIKTALPRCDGWSPKRHGDTRWGNKYRHAGSGEVLRHRQPGL